MREGGSGGKAYTMGTLRTRPPVLLAGDRFRCCSVGTPEALSPSEPRSCGPFSLDAGAVGGGVVSGRVRKLKTEYLSRFTLGNPTKVELGVEKKKRYSFRNKS